MNTPIAPKGNQQSLEQLSYSITEPPKLVSLPFDIVRSLITLLEHPVGLWSMELENINAFRNASQKVATLIESGVRVEIRLQPYLVKKYGYVKNFGQYRIHEDSVQFANDLLKFNELKFEKTLKTKQRLSYEPNELVGGDKAGSEWHEK